MKKYTFLSIILIAFYGLVACDSTISVTPLPYESKLSIQCLITPNEKPVLYLYQTVPYFDPKVSLKQLFIPKAKIVLSSILGNETLLPDSSFNIIRCEYDYFYSGKNPIKVNTQYSLLITYNGVEYSATATTNQTIVGINQITYLPLFSDVYGEHEGIKVDFKDKLGITNFYRYEMSRVIKDTIFKAETQYSPCTVGKTNFVREVGRSVYPDKNLDGETITFTFEPTYKHKLNQVGYIKLQSVDKSIYEFYDNLDRQKLAQFNPFVEPVFIKPGQFGSKAIGVFGAYVLSDSVRFVFPE